MEGREIESVEYVKCDLCGSNKANLLLKAKDYRFGYHQTFNIMKCQNCTLIYINPRPTYEIIKELYEKYYIQCDTNRVHISDVEPSLMKKLWYKYTGHYLEDVASNVEGRVLDIGCGQGHLLYRLKRKKKEAYGLEINLKAVKVCSELDLNVRCGTLKTAQYPDNFFDSVIMSQVIEHLSSPVETMQEVHRILSRNGKVFIFCPNAGSYLSIIFSRCWHGWHVPFHFYAFTRETIHHLAERTNFVVEQIKSVTPDHFFIVSLKSFLYGHAENKKGKIFDFLGFRVAISLVLRVLDFILPGKGDCLWVVLKKI